MARAQRKSTSLMVKVLFCLLIVYLLYILIGLRLKISKKQSEISDLDIQVSSGVAENDKLTSILNADIDAEYIEQIARELGFVNSDEKVYQSITD